MLQVKTKLGISKIKGAGIGLFAAVDIEKNEIIWSYNPLFDKVYTHEEFICIKGHEGQFLHTYCYRHMGKYYLCLDNARFFNHSNKPNCYSANFDEFNQGYTRALRDIKEGEELTDDYSKFGITPQDKEFNSL
jgi:SET domain-containing protein